MTTKAASSDLPETKHKLVDAGLTLMRSKGFNATTVDEICAVAGVTKGGFFHYFKSKQEIAKAAVEHFSLQKDQAYKDAPYSKLTDPLDRVFGRLDFMKESVGGASRKTKGCLIGMFAQELSFTDPELRGICHERFLRMGRDFEKDLVEAKLLYAASASFEPKKLAALLLSIFQGSSLLAKASASNKVIVDNIEQFREYLNILFTQPSAAKTPAQSRN
jgi:TetR/AcrR family transcriptional repressor of nem operon